MLNDEQEETYSLLSLARSSASGNSILVFVTEVNTEAKKTKELCNTVINLYYLI
jgi:hypothetical protein